MSGNSVSLDLDLRRAVERLDELPDAVNQGGKDIVKQLSILAEGPMKKHAPEGAGRDKHLRDTITTKFSRDGLKATVRPTKETSDGIPLVEIITDDPDWDTDDIPLAPLQEWTGAKWGDPSIAAAARLRNHLIHSGATTMPNPFVDDSIEEWEGQVEDVSGDQMRDALGRLGVT